MGSHVRVNGVNLSYNLTGKGLAVLLLHGWTCNSSFWKEQVDFLAATHQVVTLDFRGHGESGTPGQGYTLESLAEDVHALLQVLDVGRVVAVGHSMGGMVAQQLAVSHPEDLSGLVLIATVCGNPEGGLISQRIASEAPRTGYRAAFLHYFPEWFTPDSEPSLVEWAKSEMLRTGEQVALSLVRAYQDLDFRAELPRLRIPCLVIGGQGDTSTPVARSQEIADLVPGARLVVIEGVGHFVPAGTASGDEPGYTGVPFAARA